MQGQTEDPVKVELPEYDPSCYLCPGNKRMGAGETNPDYKETFVSVALGLRQVPIWAAGGLYLLATACRSSSSRGPPME